MVTNKLPSLSFLRFIFFYLKKKILIFHLWWNQAVFGRSIKRNRKIFIKTYGLCKNSLAFFSILHKVDLADIASEPFIFL